MGDAVGRTKQRGFHLRRVHGKEMTPSRFLPSLQRSALEPFDSNTAQVFALFLGLLLGLDLLPLFRAHPVRDVFHPQA